MGEQKMETAAPLEAVRAVLSAFVGVRGQKANQSVRLNPWHVVVIGVVIAAAFVAVLILLVKFIVGQAA